jgi:hypothetical protein
MVNHARRQPDVYEVFEKVVAASSRADKIAILRNNDHHAIRDILRGTFDDSIQWNLPGGKPPFEPNVPESVPSSLLKQNRQFKYFVVGGAGDRLSAAKREKLFIGVLESIHPSDAAIVINMSEKKSPGKGITKKLVQEAYPDLIRT